MISPNPSAHSPSSAPVSRESEEMTLKSALIAMGLGTILILLVALGIRYTEMVTGRYISHGVPPLPSTAAVLAMSLLRPLLRRFAPRLAPSRAQILIVYIMLTISTILSGSYHMRAFLPHLVALQYHERPGGTMKGTSYASFLPKWYAPHDKQVVEDYYNGAHNRKIPWEAWIGPLSFWCMFLTAIFIGVYCLMHLVEKQWTRNEKLSFPLLNLPLAITSEDWSSYGQKAARKSLFAFGFGAAVLFSGLNITHILQPTVPSPGFYLSLSEWFQTRPLQPLGSITFFYMLEAIGIGYFVPLEVSFSTWFFYLTNRVFAIMGTAAGYDRPGFPFTQEQSAGGYIAVGLLLLYGLRHTWGESLRRSFRRARPGQEAPAERWAWIGLVACTVFVLAFSQAAGLSLKISIPFFIILGFFVLVFARIRAETGVPFGFIYPYNLPKEGLLNIMGFETALGWGGTRSIVIFSSLAWLSRHHFAEEHAAYQMDGIKLSQESRIGRKILFGALMVAFLVGLGAALWVHLSAYYVLGTNMAGGGMGTGEFRATVAQQEYQQMATRLANPPERDLHRIAAMGGGFLFTVALHWLRLRWLGSPFHPLGFILATAYGDASAMWFPVFIAWLLKALILRAGGLQFYRRGIPFFLGLAIGHFFMAGMFWPVFSLFIAPEASHAYHLYFGG